MPSIKNKIVAVYHCNEIGGFNLLPSDIQISVNYVNAYRCLPRGERERDVPAEKETELPLAETPRELALTETSYMVRQKPKNGY